MSYIAPQQGYPYPPPGLPPASPYAHWGKRVAARLLDTLFGMLACIPMIVGFALIFGTATWVTDPEGNDTVQFDQGGTTAGGIVLAVGVLFAIGFGIWNQLLRQGRGGASLGKSILRIRVIRESTGRPTGFWLQLGRQILHVLDSALIYIGYLWPLWDSKRQTFADKIAGTVVLDESRVGPVGLAGGFPTGPVTPPAGSYPPPTWPPTHTPQ